MVVGWSGPTACVTKTSDKLSLWLVFTNSPLISTTNTPKPNPHTAKPARMGRLQPSGLHVNEAKPDSTVASTASVSN